MLLSLWKQHLQSSWHDGYCLDRWREWKREWAQIILLDQCSIDHHPLNYWISFSKFTLGGNYWKLLYNLRMKTTSVQSGYWKSRGISGVMRFFSHPFSWQGIQCDLQCLKCLRGAVHFLSSQTLSIVPRKSANRLWKKMPPSFSLHSQCLYNRRRKSISHTPHFLFSHLHWRAIWSRTVYDVLKF